MKINLFLNYPIMAGIDWISFSLSYFETDYEPGQTDPPPPPPPAPTTTTQRPVYRPPPAPPAQPPARAPAAPLVTATGTSSFCLISLSFIMLNPAIPQLKFKKNCFIKKKKSTTQLNEFHWEKRNRGLFITVFSPYEWEKEILISLRHIYTYHCTTTFNIHRTLTCYHICFFFFVFFFHLFSLSLQATMIALESYARRSSARLSSTFVSANAARFARVSFSPDININHLNRFP